MVCKPLESSICFPFWSFTGWKITVITYDLHVWFFNHMLFWDHIVMVTEWSSPTTWGLEWVDLQGSARLITMNRTKWAMASIAMWIFQKVISIKLNYIDCSKSIHFLYIHIFIVYNIYCYGSIYCLVLRGFSTSWENHWIMIGELKKLIPNWKLPLNWGPIQFYWTLNPETYTMVN